MTRRSINVIQFWLRIGFFSIPGIAFSLAGYVRFRSGYFAQAVIDVRSYIGLTMLVTLLWALVVEFLGLNRSEKLLTLQTGIRTAAIATAYCTLLALSSLFFYRNIMFARLFIVTGCALIFIFSVLMIHLFRGILLASKESIRGQFPIAIVGADDFAAQVARHISLNRLTPCRVACFVALPDQHSAVLDSQVVAWSRLDDVVDRFHCREVLVALPSRRWGEVQGILEVVQRLCVPARVVLDWGEGVFVPDRIFDFYGLPLLDVRPNPVDTVAYAIGKRVFDVSFSLLVLIMSAPLILLIGLAISLTTLGPVLFVQERVSLNGKRFKMLKFRTMAVQDRGASDTRHTKENDPRITLVGRFLRKTSLDELPQFINVLIGDMSVVGPRPELTFFVQKFRQELPEYMARHYVKSGITGWAQVNGLRGSHTSISQRIQYDLYYLQNWSMMLDLKIIFLTVLTALASRNAV